jgi:hypothetical protein
MQISRIRLSDKTSRLHPRHVVPWQNGSSHNKIERCSLISQAFRLEYVTFAPNGCAWQAAVPFETKEIEQ